MKDLLLQALRKWQLPIVVAINGAIIMIIELTGSRILAPYFGSSLYVWTSIIGVIMICLALGYYYGGRLADARPDRLLLARIITLAALVLLATKLAQTPFLIWLATTRTEPLLGSLIASFVLFAPFTILLGLVSPFAARLQIQSIKDSGSQIGTIYAAGTLGSIFGTFLTGYLLFTTLGNTLIVLWCVVGLILAAAICSVRADKLLRLAITTVVVGIICYPAAFLHTSKNVILDKDSGYNRILVTDAEFNGRPARLLQTDALGAQSGIYLDGVDMPFPYVNAFAYLATVYPRRYLVLGGGAYTLPGVIARADSDAKLDVVEIDPAFESIAREYFGYSPSVNTRIFEQDGREFLNRNQDKYDVIYMDVYNSLSPPFHLTTSEAIEQLKSSLVPDGVVAVNIISTGTKDSFLSVVSATYGRHFAHQKAYVLEPGISRSKRQNLVLLASNKPIRPLKHELFASELPIQPGTQVLVDDFAPVEALTF